MSLSSQTLSQDYLNLLRNDIIKFEVSPLVYQIIIEWGFKKPDGLKIIDHFEDLKIVEKSGMKLGPWLKRNKTVLDKEDFSSFDVTTLHDLLPVLCYDKISPTGGKEWEDKLKDTNSIEYILKEIKTFRNDVSHEYIKAKQEPNIGEKKEFMKKCIRTAGALYAKDQSEIDGKIAHLEAKFDELVYDTTSSYENTVKNVTKLVEKESASFMQEMYSPSFSVHLPGGLGKVCTTQIFQSVILSLVVKNKGTSVKTVFSSTEICNHVINKFVVINGGPGSGKTVLMRNIFQNILDNSINGSEMSYKGISRFKVPIYLECRTERQNNLRDFLKESIPNFNSPKEVIYDAFKEMKGQVFLIDGYDEVNDDSRKLVDEIIPFCRKYNATCIVSGRVDAGNNFIRDLKDKNLSCDQMFIEPFSEINDKVSFLKRYGDKMSDVDSEELVKTFEDQNNAAQKVFCSPVHLALFISLFLNNRNCLSKLHNEQSAYKAMRETFSNEIQKKLRDSYVSNPKGRTKDILAVFSYYSLMLFNSEKYFFEEDNYERLIGDCEEKLSKNVDIERLLTCILTPETSLKSGKPLTYAFTHRTIQEYLALEQIIKNMIECKIDWSSDQISEDSLRQNLIECLGLSTTHPEVNMKIMRHGNIIKLLILETLASGELTRYTKTFTAVLGKYYKMHYYHHYLFDLVSSSSCDLGIVSIVSNVLRDVFYFRLNMTPNIRPLTEILKMRVTSVIKIEINFSCSLKDITLANLGKLLLLLKDDSRIELNFHHSYQNFQPLNGEFYTQLKSIKCDITEFTACITSSEHLYIVRTVCRGTYKMDISTVSAYDLSFAILNGYRGQLELKVKYTDDCPSTGSNPVTGNTILWITNIPVDGKEKLYSIIKFLCPKSKQFESIKLINCHLTDIDANELLKKLEGEKIGTKEGEKTEVYEINRQAVRRENERREAEEPEGS